MRTTARLVVTCLVALPLLLVPGRVIATPASALDAILVATMSASTKALDLGIGNSGTPSVWDTAAYDDTAWDHAVPISGDTVDCIHASLGDLGKLPLFWGLKPDHYYALRVTIRVPAAQSYIGSAIDYANNDGTNAVSFNGTLLPYKSYHPGWPNGLHAFDIKPMVVPGVNVLGIVEGPSTTGCKGVIGARITIHAQGVKGSVPAPSTTPVLGPAVSPVFPAEGAIVAGASLPLSWKALPTATAYLVHVWLLKAGTGQLMTVHTTATIARTVIGNHVSIVTSGMLKGVYCWNVAAVNAKGILIADWSLSRSMQLE
jgi:hypothetical protein